MSSWVRLWHDMPTDPKWRVIARRSGASLSEVIAVFTFVLVNASANATERGRTHNLFADDIAAALDMDDATVEAILAAMEGKVLSKGALIAWEKRQPKREDNSADRARQWREEQKAERKRTQPNATEHPETDTETEEEEAKASPSSARSAFPRPDFVDVKVWDDFLINRRRKRQPNTASAHKKMMDDVARISALTGEPPGVVVRECVARGWAGIYDFTEKSDGDRSGGNRGRTAGPAGGRDNRDGFERALDRRIFGSDDPSGRSADGGDGSRRSLPSPGDDPLP